MGHKSIVSTDDVLKVGTTPKYFSIEDYAADIDQARLFTGMHRIFNGSLYGSKPDGYNNLRYGWLKI